METPKWQVNPAASGAAAGLRERAKALEPLGWAGRRAEWIALACFHGGVFTRQQSRSFLGRHHEEVGRAVRKLVAQGVAIEERPPGINGIGRICRIHGRRIYKALGVGDHRRRRITSPEVMMRRLLALDYVLEHPRLPWLATEADRVAAFEALGIEREVLPQPVYRGAKHGDLWKALWDLSLKIEVVAVARRWKEYGRTRRVLTNWSRYPRPSDIDEQTRCDLVRIEQAILGGMSASWTNTAACRPP